MKKFVQKIILLSLIVGIPSVVFPYAVDPFNVFHIDNIRDNGVEPSMRGQVRETEYEENKNQIKKI